MAGTVAPRPNHYDRLGVSPTAERDEIARAFARQGSVFQAHAFGGLAEVCTAYETLRDPIKRRAYDASLGLIGEPNPSTSTAPIAQSPLPQRAVARPAIDPVPPRAPPIEPAFRLGPAEDPLAGPEPRFSRGSSPRLNVEEELGVEARPVDWKRTGFALGGAVAAICVLGGLVGWWSSSAIGETPQPENAVSIALPPAQPATTPETPPTAAAPLERVAEVKERPKPRAAAKSLVEETSVALEPTSAERPAQESPPDPSAAVESASEASPISAVTASMPLPDRVVARTIERIGYSCGSVASTTPVDGEAPGVFMVTCSSGQSYRASPVKGRYHFRRWGRR